ncbi:MAG: hypothetical protein EOO47_08710 [Flavobacterium sp.]|nr:MAG: hypothetical protein EOO47_08710 [Flavobacterium sp.]
MPKKFSFLLRFAIALVICFVVHLLVSLFSSLFVNSYIINTRLANFTIYDGYADFRILLSYISLSVLLIYNKIKGNGFLITMAAFFVFFIGKAFIVDAVDHYIRFYFKTQQNGAYSFGIFVAKLCSILDNFFFELTNLGQFLSFVIWQFLAVLTVCYLSLSFREKPLL